jgi:hypothetical protein
MTSEVSRGLSRPLRRVYIDCMKAAKPKKTKTSKGAAANRGPVLPPPVELERICKGLAALDAMMCEEWQDRYYSFDRAWNTKSKQRMASMRNGHGDEWFILFDEGGVFMKAFWHEYPHEDVAKIYDGLPTKLRSQLKEPAFSMEHVTFGGWHDGTTWTLRGNAVPMADDLAILTGEPEKYVAYAADYFETTLPVDAVAHVLAGKKLDAKLVKRITTDRTLADLKDDLAEIAY